MKKNYASLQILLFVFTLNTFVFAQTTCTLSPPSVSGVTIAPCTTSSSFTLTANGGSGNTISWYSNTWGGNAISNGSVLTTPVFTSGTTYYVGANNGATTSSITLPYFVSGYSGNTRGMYFTAPTNFVITGVRVPTDVGGSSNSAIAIMKFPSAPPAYATTTNSFNLLYLNQNITTTNVVTVNIPVWAGDVIGILGARGNVTSYGPTGTSIASLGTHTLTLDRLGMQYVLSSTTPQDLWSESAGSLGRIEVYTSIGCLSTLTPVTVTVTAAPQVNISGPTGSICAGSSYTLNASGVTSYTWVGGPQTSSYVINPTSQTTYSLLGSISSTCGSSAAITVSVNSGVPALSVAASNSVVCSGNSVSISAGGATTYTLTGSSGTVANNAVFYPNSTSTYTIAGMNACGTTTAVTSITVNATPTLVTSASSSVICDGDATILSVNGASTYTWNPGNLSGSSVTVTPNAPTAYVVDGLSAQGCPSSTSQIVLVNPTPTVSSQATKTLVCAAGASTLIASGANTYSWNTSAMTSSTIVNPNQTTTYTVTGTYTNTGCNSNTVITVSVFDPVLSVSSNTSACYGAAVTLSANAGVGSVYTWSVINSPFASITVTAVTTDTYVVSVLTTSNGVTCPKSNSVVLTVNPLPTVTASSTRTSICKGEKTNLTAGGAITYTWSNNANTNTIQVSPTSGSPVYSLQGSDANGCVNSATIQIVVKSCTGIGEEADKVSVIQVYPNPNDGEFTVKMDKRAELQLYNELGQFVQSIELNESNDFEVRVGGLSNGVYYMSGTTDDQQKVHLKFIVLK